jgi:peptide/nickel transport system permease protein
MQAAVQAPASLRRSSRRLSSTITRVLLIVLPLAVAAAVVVPQLLTPHDPFKIAGALRLEEPGAEFWLGTDHLGRDMFSRLIIGTRPSLLIAAGVCALAAGVGLFTGLIAGYYRWLDNVVMRLMDAMMAFPAIVLALAIVAILGRSVTNLIFAIAVVYAPQISRVCRSAVLACREQDYVTAAVAGGASDWWVITRHLLPNVLPVLSVQATYFFARALIYEASLSFLGLGLPPDIPTWGSILGEGRRFLRDAPWTTVFPGLTIAAAVVAINLFGDRLRDRLDPRLRALDRAPR